MEKQVPKYKEVEKSIIKKYKKAYAVGMVYDWVSKW